MNQPGALQRWLDVHPLDSDLGSARAARSGLHLYRRWLVLRIFVAVAVGIGVLLVTTAFRSAVP